MQCSKNALAARGFLGSSDPAAAALLLRAEPVARIAQWASAPDNVSIIALDLNQG